MNIETANLDDLRVGLARGAFNSVELVAALRHRVEAIDRRGLSLRAVRELNPSVDAQAARADEDRARGRQSPLLGIPVLVKDNIDVAGLETTAGSLALAGWRRTSDAAVVARVRGAGAIVLGKTNMTEWANFMAHGMPGGYSAVGGQVRNPYDLTGSPSGSSSGSAVAVAAGFAPLALGTETICSLLSPANACSVVGVRPTPGNVDLRGVVPLASSYDTVGPLATTVSGAATLLAVLRGDRDQVRLVRGGLYGARIGVTDVAAPRGADALWRHTTSALAGLGAELASVELAGGFGGQGVLAYEFRRDIDAYLSELPEHARVHSLAEVVEFNATHPDEELRYGQAQLLQCLALDLDDPLVRARYRAALLADRTQARARLGSAFTDDGFSALIFPAEGGCGMSARAGLPSVSLPIGYCANGRPFGVSLVGPAGSDDRLLSFAFDLEQTVSDRRAPTLHARGPG